MSHNSQKLPFTQSFDKAASRKVLEAIQILGKALPASVVSVDGSIVTVKFEVKSDFTLPQVTIPMFGPEYIRYPTQVGDLGVVFPADVYIAGISGLGDGTADLSLPGNLAALIFFPIASKKWSPTEDPDALVMYGKNGVVLRDKDKKTIITLTPDGITIVVAAGDSVAITGDLAVTGNITATGDITAHV